MFGFRLIRRVLSALLLLALVIPLFAVGKVWVAAHNPKPRKAEVIVVLGAAQFDGRPSGALLARLVEAKRIYDVGFAPSIITVGAGAPGDRTTEAASAKFWLENHGVPKKRIVAIEKGRDTFVSTRAYIAEMKKRKLHTVIIVTDPYHCLRAMTMATDLGAKPSCSPVRTGANSLANSSLHYLIRETGAYLAYVTLGRRGIHLSDHLSR
ncbi:MAG: YdcF family protein [Candidatus Nanopelagicaceae bacterium]|nr:YdcF family protein [Candidatus Nanopelagicaceae bacterium]